MHDLSLQALRSFSGVGAVEFWAPTTALLLIDLQNSCLHEDGYTRRRLRERGLAAAEAEYCHQVEVAVPNLQRVLTRAREASITVIHTHVVSLGGQLPGGQTRPGRVVAAGSDQANIVAALAPQPGEIVVPKACSGVFAGTNLDYVLRRLGIRSLIVGGVVTNGCVEQAITHGHDLGYACVLLSDGSAALTDEIHTNALERLEHRRAHVLPTERVLTESGVRGTGA